MDNSYTFDFQKKISHPLFTRIKREHQEILGITQTLLENPSSITQLLELLQNHHHNEERLIFKRLKENPRLREGGPMCTYFYDEQITSPPLAIAKSLTKKEVLWREDQQDLINPPTPILIPMGEHRAIISLVSFLAHEKMDQILKQKIHRECLRIIKSNIAKEENCFFKVCGMLLDLNDLDQAHQQWQAPKKAR